MLLSLIGLIFGQIGWLIGTALGTVLNLINSILVYKGTEVSLKESKTGFFLLSYFVRMFLFFVFFAVLVVLQYKLEIDAFKNSFWGMAIAFFPSIMVTVLVQLKYKGGENNGQI